MDWEQVLIMLVPFVPFVPLFLLMSCILKEIRAARKETRERTDSIRAGTAEMRKGFQEEIRVQVQRSDKLYEMFIALLEKQGPRTNP